MTRRILLCAGEASGDILGAELMDALRKQNKGLVFAGIGGPQMKAAGLEMIGDIDEFPGMGLVEVVGSIPRLMKLGNRVMEAARQQKPDLCVTIDNQEFSKRLAAKLAPQGIRCVQYVAPKVWAWRQGRVHKLKTIFSQMLCLFPFEAEFFNAHGLPATYIGHPVVGRMQAVKPQAVRGLQLALLPGSRRGELGKHWPLFLDVYRHLRQQMPQLSGLVAVDTKTTLQRLKDIGWAEGLTSVVGARRFEALSACTAALTKSGTNNLEIALLGVPAVVAYRMNSLTYAILKYILRLNIPLISPPNLVLGKMVYPEKVQDAASVNALAEAVKPLLAETGARQRQQEELRQVAVRLATESNPVERAAEVILAELARA